MTVREPRVAGTFYPASKRALLAFLDTHIDKKTPEREAKAVLMPHAGYIYSGITAALTISRVKVTETVLLIGPNHTGLGADFSLMASGMWKTPLGSAAVDEEAASALLKASPLISDDFDAHQYEHSLEVEVPFLQYKQAGVKIVPLTVSSNNFDDIRSVAEAIGDNLAKRGREILIVASSDMTHYESEASAREKDRYAIDAMLALDENALREAVKAHKISMCGFVPAYMTIIAAKRLGAEKAELIDYRTSAEASGDTAQVVGYAGIVVS
ncbi:MAG: AmmeMemoRadiSam system protein B [Candidatus Omnitrophica bacterium]|nr:AmmeMemoRadiSam system protein B [Candidatus Omnitrophota bacterium]